MAGSIISSALVLAFVLSFYFVGCTGPNGLKVGDTAPIPRTSSLYDRITPDPDFCVFAQGATVTIVDVSKRHVLTTYKANGTEQRECPDGTKVVMTRYEFHDLTRKYEEQKASERDRGDLLGGEGGQ